MGRIILSGMRFRSYIGVYAFEQDRGNEFEVDVTIESNILSGDRDELGSTIDYAQVHDVVKTIMGNRYHLIEFAAKEMQEKIVAGFSVDYVKVRISKMNPPLDGDVYRVSAELEWRK